MVNIGSGNVLLPDSTEPLPEPMLTSHQWGSVVFTVDHLRRQCSRYQLVKWVWKFTLSNCFHISQGPLGCPILVYRPITKSHNVPVQYATTHHSVTEMCTHVHIPVTKWCIVVYLSDALWDFFRWIYCYTNYTVVKWENINKFWQLNCRYISVADTAYF